MNVAHETETTTRQHTYYRTAQRRNTQLTLCAICVCIAGAIIWKDWNTSQMLVGLAAGGFLLVVILILFYIVFGSWKKTYIVTSPQGLTKYSPSYSVYTPWTNITGRTTIPMGKAGRIAALQLQQAPTEMPISQAMQHQQPASEFKHHWIGFTPGLSGYHDLILVGEFMNGWDDSNGLAQDIHQYAPQAFNEAA